MRPSAHEIKNDHLDRIVHGWRRDKARASSTPAPRLLEVPPSKQDTLFIVVPGVITCSSDPHSQVPGSTFALTSIQDPFGGMKREDKVVIKCSVPAAADGDSSAAATADTQARPEDERRVRFAEPRPGWPQRLFFRCEVGHHGWLVDGAGGARWNTLGQYVGNSTGGEAAAVKATLSRRASLRVGNRGPPRTPLVEWEEPALQGDEELEAESSRFEWAISDPNGTIGVNFEKGEEWQLVKSLKAGGLALRDCPRLSSGCRLLSINGNLVAGLVFDEAKVFLAQGMKDLKDNKTPLVFAFAAPSDSGSARAEPKATAPTKAAVSPNAGPRAVPVPAAAEGASAARAPTPRSQRLRRASAGGGGTAEVAEAAAAMRGAVPEPTASFIAAREGGMRTRSRARGPAT